MKALEDRWAIVLVGHWDVSLFSPPWVAEHLADSEDVTLEVDINTPGFATRLNFDNIYLHVDQDRLVLSRRDQTDDLLRHLQSAAIKILGKLQYTPVTTVGVNFQFMEETLQGKLLNIFSLPDEGELSDIGASIKSRQIKRTLSLDDYLLNLTASLLENDKVLLDLNFYRDVNSADEAKKYLESELTITEFRDRGIDLLNSVYQLTEDDE